MNPKGTGIWGQASPKRWSLMELSSTPKANRFRGTCPPDLDRSLAFAAPIRFIEGSCARQELSHFLTAKQVQTGDMGST